MTTAPAAFYGQPSMLSKRALSTVSMGALLVLCALAFVASGCGGGDDTNENPSEFEELLPQVVLAEEDLTTGVQQVSAFFSTNQDVADAVIDTEGELAKLEGWGRVLGYDAQFEPGPEAPVDTEVQGVQSTASVYATTQGAADSFAEAVSDARDTAWEERYPGVADLEVEEVDRSDLADEYVWFRISGLDENSGKLVIDDQVAFRVSSVRGFLRVVTVFDASEPRDVYQDEVAEWVRLLAARIAGSAITGGVSATATP